MMAKKRVTDEGVVSVRAEDQSNAARGYRFHSYIYFFFHAIGKLHDLECGMLSSVILSGVAWWVGIGDLAS